MPSSPTPALLNHAVSTPCRAASSAAAAWAAGSRTSCASPAAAPISAAVRAAPSPSTSVTTTAVAARHHPLGDAAPDPAGSSGDDAAGGARRARPRTGGHERSQRRNVPARPSEPVACTGGCRDPTLRIAPVEDNLLAFLDALAAAPVFEVDGAPDVTTYRSRPAASRSSTAWSGGRFTPGPRRSAAAR